MVCSYIIKIFTVQKDKIKYYSSENRAKFKKFTASYK